MNSLNLLLQSPQTLRLGWTLIHSLWQLLAVALLLAACLPALRRRGPQAASVACCGALGFCCLISVITFLLLPLPAVNEISPSVFKETNVAIAPRNVAISHPPLMPRHGSVPSESMTSEKFVQTDRDVPSAAAPVQTRLTEQFEVALQSEAVSVRIGRQLRAMIPILVAGWFVGVLILSIWNCGAWFAVQRLRISSTLPVTLQIQQTANRLARKLGLHQAVQLLQSTLVESPVVIGAWKPVILLPMSLVLQLPPDQLEALLAHELAHILRRDYLINLMQTVLETLMFYHPAVWWISAQVRRERENCCDDLALRLVENRVVYVRALAAIADSQKLASIPAANGGHLLQRLQRILGMTPSESIHPTRWLAGMTLLSICGLIAGLSVMPERAILADNPGKQQNSDVNGSLAVEKIAPDAATDVKKLLKPQATSTGTMRIRVSGPDGMPLSGANVHPSVWTDEKDFKKNSDYTTDAKGIAEITLPKTMTILRIWASHDGYCKRFEQWWPERQSNRNVIPEDMEFSLEKGTVIGGVVKNAEGQAIPGVQVQVQGLATGDPKSINGSKCTDDNGRWTLGNVPADETEVEIFLTHPDYISDTYYGGLQKEQNISMAALRDQTATIVMPSGTSIRGQVVDPDGRPVEKAVVIWGDDPYFQAGSQEVLTDMDGRFRLPPFPKKPIRVTVAVKGWMPESKIVSADEALSPIDFHLQPGKTLRIKVVDQSGQPLKDVHVSLRKWRKSSALYNAVHPNVISTQIPGATNEEGLFEWTWAPQDSVSFDFYKDGFSHTSNAFVASEAVQTLIMNQSTTISGTVRDATTGKKIDKFTMVAINYFSENFLGVERMNEKPRSNGEFAYEMTRTDLSQGVQIEALGYRTFRTPKRYQTRDTADVIDVRLEPVQPFKGRVVSPTGMPAQNTKVYVATEYEHLGLFNLDGDRVWKCYHADSDESGEFEVIPQSDRYKLVVMSAEGYGEIDRDADELPGEIRLKPWAKLTGQLVQSGQPMAKQQVSLNTIGFVAPGEPNYSNRQAATTDDNGMFTFERVAPVASHVKSRLHFAVDSVLKSSRSVPLDLKPGETMHVVLGGGGAQVSGQLVVENAPADFDYHFSISYLVAKRPGIPVPGSIARKGFDWRKGWSDSWRGTEEGRAYLDTLHQWFVKPDPDGKINISGVEPGEYELAINLYGTTEGCLVHPIAQRVIAVTVQPGQKTLELGTVVIPSLPVPQVGDVVRDIPFTDATGQQTSLGIGRGKYVLIDFWASWCAPCMAKLPEVEQLRQYYGSNNQLVVVGANLDDNGDMAQSVIKSKGLNWKHVLMGEWSKSSVPRQFGISSLPTYVLVDPSGRIAIHSRQLKDVEQHLKLVGVK